MINKNNPIRCEKFFIVSLMSQFSYMPLSGQLKENNEKKPIISTNPFFDSVHHWYDIHDDGNIVNNCTLFDYGTNSTSYGIISSNTAAAHTNGVRTTATLTISNSYRTTDYDDAFTPAYSIMSSLTAYSGASTALWTDPVNGNFSFLDTNSTGKNSAGDPRWRP